MVVTTKAKRITGKVTDLVRNFGFIEVPGCSEKFYFNESGREGGSAAKPWPKSGQAVSFIPRDSARGPYAQDWEIVGANAPAVPVENPDPYKGKRILRGN